VGGALILMKRPYVPHVFGDEAILERARARRGWLTVGVA
jgi:hypothetical protein